MNNDKNDKIVNAIKEGDVAALCAAVWDSAEVWARAASGTQRKIVEDWFSDEESNAVDHFSPRDAWERVAGKDVEIEPTDVEEIIADAVDACWCAMVDSAIDNLLHEKKRIDESLNEVERMIDILKR